jgi:tetratricopeptide (TPR) repeat protein
MLQIDRSHARAPSARLELGECAVLLGKPDAAVPALEEFLRGKPEDHTEQARAHLALGRARALRNEHEKAETSYQRVTELSEGPLAAEAQFRIGESRAARHDDSGAADAFVKLSILYAHEEWVRRGLLQAGLAYERLQQPPKAKRFFEELVRRFPKTKESQEAQSRLRGI